MKKSKALKPQELLNTPVIKISNYLFFKSKLEIELNIL